MASVSDRFFAQDKTGRRCLPQVDAPNVGESHSGEPAGDFVECIGLPANIEEVQSGEAADGLCHPARALYLAGQLVQNDNQATRVESSRDLAQQLNVLFRWV